jgi:hypothetical protein
VAESRLFAIVWRSRAGTWRSKCAFERDALVGDRGTSFLGWCRMLTARPSPDVLAGSRAPAAAVRDTQRVPAGVLSGENVLGTLVREPAHAHDITADQHFVRLPFRRKQIRRDRDSYVERSPRTSCTAYVGSHFPSGSVGIVILRRPPSSRSPSEPRRSGVIEDTVAPVSITPGCLSEPSGRSWRRSASRSSCRSNRPASGRARMTLTSARRLGSSRPVRRM